MLPACLLHLLNHASGCPLPSLPTSFTAQQLAWAKATLHFGVGCMLTTATAGGDGTAAPRSLRRLAVVGCICVEKRRKGAARMKVACVRVLRVAHTKMLLQAGGAAAGDKMDVLVAKLDKANKLVQGGVDAGALSGRAEARAGLDGG